MVNLILVGSIQIINHWPHWNENCLFDTLHFLLDFHTIKFLHVWILVIKCDVESLPQIWSSSENNKFLCILRLLVDLWELCSDSFIKILKHIWISSSHETLTQSIWIINIQVPHALRRSSFHIFYIFVIQIIRIYKINMKIIISKNR